MSPGIVPLGDLKPAAKTLPAVNEQQQPRRRVTISGKVKIREIPHLNDMDQDIIDALFLMPEDYAEFKKNYTVIVRRMMKQKDEFVPDDSENCSRGLGECSDADMKSCAFLSRRHFFSSPFPVRRIPY